MILRPALYAGRGLVMIYSLRAVRPDFALRGDHGPPVPTSGRFRKLRFVLDALTVGVGPIGVTAPVKAPVE